MNMKSDENWKNFLERELEEGGWKNALEANPEKPDFKELCKYVEKEYASEKYEVYPPKEQIFRALKLCKLKDVKVVIVGQDPYPKKGYADGLSFSLGPDVCSSISYSLRRIFEEIERNFPDKEVLKCGNLTRWAEQGVLLLNSILTVQAGHPKSHKGKGWEDFTESIIRAVSTRAGDGVVFMLWGSYAERYIELHKYKELIDQKKNCVLTCPHPASRNGGWVGNEHFKKANRALERRGLKPIDW